MGKRNNEEKNVTAIYEGNHIECDGEYRSPEMEKAFFLLTVTPQGKQVYTVTANNLRYWHDPEFEEMYCHDVTDAEMEKIFVSDGIRFQAKFDVLKDKVFIKPIFKDPGTWTLEYLRSVLESEGIRAEPIIGKQFVPYITEEKLYLQGDDVTYAIRFERYRYSYRVIFDFKEECCVPEGLEAERPVCLGPALISNYTGLDVEEYFGWEENKDLREAWEAGYGESHLLCLDFADWIRRMALPGGCYCLQSKIGQLSMIRFDDEISFNSKLRIVDL